jgi:hypothetical protein
MPTAEVAHMEFGRRVVPAHAAVKGATKVAQSCATFSPNWRIIQFPNLFLNLSRTSAKFS